MKINSDFLSKAKALDVLLINATSPVCKTQISNLMNEGDPYLDDRFGA
jgi:hypothetical protein